VAVRLCILVMLMLKFQKTNSDAFCFFHEEDNNVDSRIFPISVLTTSLFLRDNECIYTEFYKQPIPHQCTRIKKSFMDLLLFTLPKQEKKLQITAEKQNILS